MNEAIAYLEKNPVQYFATVGRDGKPKVRPFQMMFREGGKLYFCTGAAKEVYRELLENPCCEICAASEKDWLRIRGRAEWVESPAKKEKAIAASALVKSIYKSAENPVFKLFYVADAVAVVSDFSGNPPKEYRLTEE